MAKQVFVGVATALVTPFKPDLSIDKKAFCRLVDRQVASRVSALVVGGTTGEGATLSIKEKLYLTEAALERSGDVPVIAAFCANDTRAAIKAASALDRVGAAALLVITPYYNKTSDNGLIRHFFTIADSVKTPVIVYNVPARTGMNVTPAQYKKLSLHKNIIGIKEADCDVVKATMALSAVKKDFFAYSGSDEAFLPFLVIGGKGIISVAANVIPNALSSVYSAFSRGDVTRAKNAYFEVYGLIRALFCQVNPIPVKYALSKAGLIKNCLRPPLLPLDEKYRKTVDKQLKILNMI